MNKLNLIQNKANSSMILFDPRFISGFSDAESSFYIRISKKSSMSSGWTVEPVFSIRLHHKDISLLHSIQHFFGVGKVYHHEGVEEATFRVSSIPQLDVIVNHFDAFPLITQKLADFLLFKDVLKIVKLKEHLTIEGVSKIASIKAAMNTTKNLDVIDLPNVVPAQLPSLPLVNIDSINPYWLAGFTAGDGCFSVSVIKSKAILGETGWLRYILTQHNRDGHLLKVISAYLGCGKINEDSKATYLVVQRLSDILQIIVPFFDKYRVEGVKLKDYVDFKSASVLMGRKAHLTREGLEELRQIKNRMNTKRI